MANIAAVIRLVLVLVLAVLAACNGKRGAPPADFGPKTVTTIDLAGFSFPVPDGYRASSELVDATRRADVQARVPGATILLDEKQPGTGVMIAVSTLARSLAITPQACIELATSEAKQRGGTLKAGLMRKVTRGQACTVALDETVGYYLAGTGVVLVIACSGGGQDERDALCAKVADSVAGK